MKKNSRIILSAIIVFASLFLGYIRIVLAAPRMQTSNSFVYLPIIVKQGPAAPIPSPTRTPRPVRTATLTRTPSPTRTPTSIQTGTASVTPTNPTVPTINPAAFTFASMGDAQGVSSDFLDTTNQISTLNPAFVIFNGDLESDGVVSSEINPMVTDLKSSGIFNQTFLVRGNHDNHVGGSASLWENYFSTSPNIKTIPVGVSNYVALDSNSTYLSYSFVYGNSMIIGLDVPGDADLLTSAQLTFLDTRLTYAESIGLVHAFIFWHGPMYCVESTHCSCTSRTDASCTPSALITVINKHPIISAFLHGHEHILGWVHMDNSRLSALTGKFEEFLTSPSAGYLTYNDYLFPARMDYTYMGIGDGQGFGTISVNGPAFTVNLYQVGISSPVWSKTFTKSAQ